MARKKAPIVVSEGTLYRTLDIVRALLTLDAVEYEYTVDGIDLSRGEGWLVRVFYSHESATLVVNNCLFINVRSFDYLHFKELSDGRMEVELVSDSAQLRLRTRKDPGRPPVAVERLRRLEDDEFEFQFYTQEQDEE